MKTSDQEKSIKRLKIKLGALTILLTLVSLCAVFILSGLATARFALALSGNYSIATKSATPPSNQLQLIDWNGLITSWNNLPADFVARTGGALSNMLGNLDMNSNRIVNVANPGTSASDVATKGYVDTAVAGAGGGGDTFTNWGQATCPAGTNLLYSGYAFHQSYLYSGGGEPTCVEFVVGDTPTLGAPTNPWVDDLSPLSTADGGQLPPGIPPRKTIKCAVCYKAAGTCFEHWGSQGCGGAAGFNPIYTGYGLGGFASRSSNIDRHCVDNSPSFDGGINSTSFDAVWYGTSIYSTTNVGLFTPQSYVKCAMCCN